MFGARSVRSGESKERRAAVGLEARTERSGEGKERRAAVGLGARSEQRWGYEQRWGSKPGVGNGGAWSQE